jgi:prepilin-type N-terminal cleavage/methylation domain-containing protein
MKRGFTLIEFLIVMGFISVIGLAITTVYVTGFQTYDQELASSTVQSDGQTILDEILTDVKNGVSIDQTYNGYVTDADTIIIKVPSIDTNGNVLYNGTDMRFDWIVYNYTGTEIHKIIYADPSSSRYPHNGIDATLDKHILSLNFTYDPDATAATLVTATVSSDITIGNEVRNITLNGQARLRNHI